MSKTHTRGNIIIEDIKVGDIHYEYDYGVGVMVEVMTKPKLDGDTKTGEWTWRSKKCSDNTKISYGVACDHPAYAPKLYDHKAYIGAIMI